MEKIGILIQIGNYDVWENMKNKIFNFLNFDFLLLLHFNIGLVNDEQIDKIIHFYKENIKSNDIHITKGENKGMDIYGFFCQIKYILDNNLKLDYILKIHTKSKTEWRNELLEPLCNSEDTISKNLFNFKDESIGMICSNEWLKDMDHFNTPIILKLLKFFKIENNYIDEIEWDKKYEKIYDLKYFDPQFYIKYKYNAVLHTSDLYDDENKLKNYALYHWLKYGSEHFRFVQNPELVTKKVDEHIKFCAGTMFWIRAEIIIDFFNKFIDFNRFEKNFEYGYFDNSKPTFTHSWERMFSIIVKINEKKIIGI